MKKYFVKKTVQCIIMLFLISLFSFAIIWISPGSLVDMYTTPDMTEEQIEKLKEHMGLDKSFPEQYTDWLVKVFQGDMGVSFSNKSPVAPQIAKRLPATLKLMGFSLVIALVGALPLGLWSGYKKNTWIDHVISGFAYIGMSMPSFWLGMLLIIFFSMQLHLFPSSGMHTVGNQSTLDTIWHMVLPCITLSLPTMAVYTRYMKSNTLKELAEEYVLTAKAKGSNSRKILWKHVLKNTLLPIITLLGMQLASLVCGSFIVESIFGWPGVGTFTMTAIKSKDYPVIMAYIMMSGLLIIIGNFLADILYGVADPRIKREIDKVNAK